VLPWRSDAAAAALRAGRHEDALRLANEELELARRFGAPRALGVALRAAGMATADGDQIELLQQSVAALESSPAELDLARSLVELGSALRRNHRPRDARDPLRRALALPVTREAVPLQDRARSELAAAGGRPRRDALEGPGALTPTERRVAELAAAGRTNPEIAVELYVTRKTVESHLAGAYRKLGITSRTDLPAMLEAE
jgi:DNA-binding CsgD family transcriptional regulator